MKVVDPTKFEIGKYYLTYRGKKGLFKRVTIFMYESVFTDIFWTQFNEYGTYGDVAVSNDMSAPVLEHDRFIAFELDDDEVFRHVTMEEITINL